MRYGTVRYLTVYLLILIYTEVLYSRFLLKSSDYFPIGKMSLLLVGFTSTIYDICTIFTTTSKFSLKNTDERTVSI
jgi:hypothetical protein